LIAKVGLASADTTLMTDQGTQLLAAVNRVRAVQELEPLRCLTMLGAAVREEDGCVLAHAMQCEMGGASDPAWEADGRWVLRFRDCWTARIVALELGREWEPEHFEVQAPELLVDFAVAFELGEVEPDEFGFVRAWRVPAGEDGSTDEWCRFVMPEMESAEPALVLT
jgi:hypothetical protein